MLSGMYQQRNCWVTILHILDQNHEFNVLITVREILSYQRKSSNPRAIQSPEDHSRHAHTWGPQTSWGPTLNLHTAASAGLRGGYPRVQSAAAGGGGRGAAKAQKREGGYMEAVRRRAQGFGRQQR